MKVHKRIGKANGGLIQDVQARTISRNADPSMRINPDGTSSDKNITRGLPPLNPADNEQGLARGGKVTKAVLRKPKGRKR